LLVELKYSELTHNTDDEVFSKHREEITQPHGPTPQKT